MKKNRMMRLASGLLVAVLMTTSVISGTFAKYVTTASGEDTARVAKWGVELTLASEVFAVEYDDATNPTVKSSNTDKLVAPGTAGTAATFSITGTPEVSTNVEVTFDAENKLNMVTLEAGEYDNPTNITPDDGLLVLGEDYNPVVWTLKRSSEETTDFANAEVVVTGNLQAIQDYFADAEDGINGEYDPNTELDEVFGYYELTWTWAFGDATGVTGNDAADTYLGNLAATNPDAENLQETFSLNITVTQID